MNLSKIYKRIMVKVGSLVLLMLLCFTEAYTDTIIVSSPWPMFQHDASHTGQSSFLGITSHPVKVWKTELPTGLGESAHGMSMGADGTVYISSNGNLYALNPRNGDIEWHFTYADNSRSTPAIGNDGMIYWGYGDSFVAITTTGQLEWGWTNLTGNYVFASSPVIDQNNNVYFSHDGLWSLTHKGEFRWFYPAYWFSHSSPAIGADGTIYAAANFNEFVALRPDGTLKWSLDVPHNDNSPALASDGTIYLGIGGVQEGAPARLLAINPDGTSRWSFILDDNIDTIWIPPAISSDGTIYFGSGTNYRTTDTSFFYAVNPDGTLKWKLSIKAKDNQDWLPFFLAPPVIDKEGNVYLCSRNCSCYGVSQDGSILWEVFFPVDITGWLAWVDTAPLIVSDGYMLILDSHGFVHAFVEPASIVYLPAVFRQYE